MTCKGICQRHKASRPKTGKRYLMGQKRCQGCEIFIDWQGTWCPCCGYRLRVNPRHSKFKLILRTIKINEIKVVYSSFSTIYATFLNLI